jgi:hypothetical protein
MEGRSLVAGLEKKAPGASDDNEGEKKVNERLAGLGQT